MILANDTAWVSRLIEHGNIDSVAGGESTQDIFKEHGVDAEIAPRAHHTSYIDR